MAKDRDNEVFLEGILANKRANKKGEELKPVPEKTATGLNCERISGVFEIKVVQEKKKGSGDFVEATIPVNFYAKSLTNKGDENPSYTNIMEVINNCRSIVEAGGEDGATRIRVNGGRIDMNEYPSRSGNLVSYPRITGSFFNAVSTDNCNPIAKFDVNAYIESIIPEENYQGDLTGRSQVIGWVHEYQDKYARVPFFAEDDGPIEGINNYWSKGDTVRIIGRLDFISTVTSEIQEDGGWGETIEVHRTQNKSDLTITGGSPGPLDIGFSEEAIESAKINRSNKLSSRTEPKPAPKTSPEEEFQSMFGL